MNTKKTFKIGLIIDDPVDRIDVHSGGMELKAFTLSLNP